MQLNKFDEPLKNYLEAIGLTATQETKIENALQAVLSLALANFPDAQIYAQGSYSTDTIAKPLTERQGHGKAGEFDIDIAIESASWVGAVGALDAVADAVEGDTTFGKLEVDNTKNSCVRIQYPEDQTGVSFHIDLVPTKVESGARFVPNRAGGFWKTSDAKRFADWFNAQAQARPGMRQVAVMLKRMRDLAGMSDDLKSIVILTLVSKVYQDTGSIMGDLLTVMDQIPDLLGGAGDRRQIPNPVNPGEDLATTITQFEDVRQYFVDTRGELVGAIAEDDERALKVIFGPGFNYASVKTTDAVKAALAITSPPRAYGTAVDALND